MIENPGKKSNEKKKGKNAKTSASGPVQCLKVVEDACVAVVVGGVGGEMERECMMCGKSTLVDNKGVLALNCCFRECCLAHWRNSALAEL